MLLHACLLALVPLGLAPRPQEDPPEITWEPHAARAADGSPLEGLLGRIRVPENRAAGNGKTIEIAFVVYASTNPDPGPPIFFLVGGPGASGVEHCAATATDPRLALLELGDVIGIDQRGTGLSRPNLEAGPEFGYQLPLERAPTRAEALAAQTEVVQRCVAYWRAQGIDPSAYDSVENAADIDAVRRALGLEQIVLFGTSYGSHLALAYLRRHAQHAARAVLMKVEGPDHTWKLASTAQALLAALHERVASDPAFAQTLPDMLGTLRALLAQLAREPVTVTLDAGRASEVRVTLGPHDLQVSLAGLLAFSQGHALVPAAIHGMARGDWTRLARAALEDRRVVLPTAMLVLMDCASGASAERRARLAREAADPANLLGDALNAPYYLDSCAGGEIPALEDDFRGPLRCDVPVLFVSGSLDARTPPANVEDIRAGFAYHAHVLVENAGHDERELESPEYCALVRDFLAGKAVASRTIRLPPVKLAPLHE